MGTSVAHGPHLRRKLRIAMYSHDAVGLGHLRRNLVIAEALRADPTVGSILMVCGAAEANLFPKPPGVDLLTLPALCKRDGGYSSRMLDVPLERLAAIRAMSIRAAMEAFQPDVFIVDKIPRGVVGELRPTLDLLRVQGRTSCVLGLRDVLDAPEDVEREWGELRNAEALQHYYEAIWVYGDPRVYDPVAEYRFPAELAKKVRFTGYLDRSTHRANVADPEGGDAKPPPGRFVYCTVGGGEDGERLARAVSGVTLRRHSALVILTGPFMPSAARRALSRIADVNPQLRVLDFVRDPSALMRCADRVVSMGGYNTVCELLAMEKRALIVPRTEPRREQQVRAQRFEALGLFDCCLPRELSPKAIEGWLERDIPKPDVRGRIDLSGLSRLSPLLRELYAAPGAALENTR